MNIPTVTLDEIEMDSEHAFGGLKCLIHTILFIRAPQHIPQTLGVEPKLAHFTYAKVGYMTISYTMTSARYLIRTLSNI